MNLQEIIDYFNLHAHTWDEEMIRSDAVIGRILFGAEVTAGKDILDIACGTGVLFPDYEERCVKSITGIDISSEMIAIAGKKFPDVMLLSGDASIFDFPKTYDCIMIYNAFPHFDDPEKLIAHLSGFLKEGGTLTVAHGMSRNRINRHHDEVAVHVSNELMGADELSMMMVKYGTVTVKISDDTMYQVTIRK